MADEDLQTQMANDFFADVGGLESDSGSDGKGGWDHAKDNDNATTATKIDDGIEVQNNQNTAPTQPQQTQAKQQDQQSAQQQQAQGQQPQKQNTQPSQPVPEGAEASLYTVNDKGEPVLDIQKALNLAQTDQRVFQGVVDPRSQPAPAQGAQQQDNRPEWEKRVEAMQTERQKSLEQFLTYEKFLEEGAKKGFTSDSLLMYARQRIEQHVEQDMTTRQAREWAKWQEEFKEQVRNQTSQEDVQRKSNTVLNQINGELGGKLNDLLLGTTDKAGQYKKGVGTDDVYMLFDMMNPDAKKNPAALPQEFQSWFAKMTSNEQTARWMVDVAQARLLKKVLPQVLKGQRAAVAAQQNSMEESKMRGASQRNAPATAEKELDSFDTWLKLPPGQRVQDVDRIG